MCANMIYVVRRISEDFAIVRSRLKGLATVVDPPLDKKAEMTNWEKVSCVHVPSAMGDKRIVAYHLLIIM
jgi:hypothetical protein